jgi:hypothetical protein
MISDVLHCLSVRPVELQVSIASQCQAGCEELGSSIIAMISRGISIYRLGPLVNLFLNSYLHVQYFFPVDTKIW